MGLQYGEKRDVMYLGCASIIDKDILCTFRFLSNILHTHSLILFAPVSGARGYRKIDFREGKIIN